MIDFPSFPSFIPFHCSQLPTTTDMSIYLPCFILNSFRYCCIWKATSKYYDNTKMLFLFIGLMNSTILTRVLTGVCIVSHNQVR